MKVSDPVALICDNANTILSDSSLMAFWPGGSVKWGAVSGVVPAGTKSLKFEKKGLKKSKTTTSFNSSNKVSAKNTGDNNILLNESASGFEIKTGEISAYISKSGTNIIDSLFYNDTKVGEAAYMLCSTQNTPAMEGVNHISYKNYNG